MKNFIIIEKLIFCLFILSVSSNLAIASDIIKDYEAIIERAFISEFSSADKKNPARITVLAKLRSKNQRCSVDFDKMLLGYRGDRYEAYEHHLSLYYQKGSLYLHTKGLVVDKNPLPEYLQLAKVDQEGALTWSPDFEPEFSFRTYRYQLSDRLIALIWGVWVKNADYPKFRLNARNSSITMIDLSSE